MSKRVVIVVCLILGAVAPSAVAQPQETTGVVTEIKPGHGKAEIRSAGGVWRPAAPLQALRPGEGPNSPAHEEAMALLRSIDAEEANQKRLAANRAFEAAVSAFNRREFSRAGTQRVAAARLVRAGTHRRGEKHLSHGAPDSRAQGRN